MADIASINLGVGAIRTGEAQTCMSVGAENMPRTPHLAPGLGRGVRIGPVTLIDHLFERGYGAKGFSPRARRCRGGGPPA
ncbi:MAG TPA: hypothetical protein PLR20_06065 [Syntrophales bacterium]|nr:hypothetical protein [Syntrophales bacterium]HOX95207.1 hypothetical protein [Syntrophales bacterium]HPI57927.1 hypothetical protein [Syntrophales bacterium]HPN24594.1 hypothetical protein [Syntrophales bacterium]HQM28900.1 hypothetical protein [Syntrophales bacterium]